MTSRAVWHPWPWLALVVLALSGSRLPAGANAAAGELCGDGCAVGGGEDLAVCGDDGFTYQSACLARCQAVGIAHPGPCTNDAAPLGKAGASSQLHRLLVEGTVDDAHRSSSSPRRVLRASDLTAFPGYKLVGVVHLKKTFSSSTSPPKATQTWTAGSSSSSSTSTSVVRALRVTRTGLLYAATVDLDALAATLRKARPKAAQKGTAGPTATASQQDQVEASPPAALGWPDWSPDTGLPNLPCFDPEKHGRSEGGGQPSQGRRLRATTAKPPPPSPPSSTKLSNATARASTTNLNLTMAVTTTTVGQAPPPPLSLPACPLGNRFPFTTIGQLQLTDPSGARVCSGTLVAADAVLTAAHCVFSRDGNGGGSFFQELDFAAGRYRAAGGVVDPFGVVAWTYATIFANFALVGDRFQFDWDVALIRLASPVGTQAGWLGLASGCATNAATGARVTSYPVSTAGYPVALPFGSCAASNCSITGDDCASRTAYHTCPSLDGQSGSPLYIAADNRVRGILVGTVDAFPTPYKVTHLVGVASYSAILSWVTEPAVPGANSSNAGYEVGWASPPPPAGGGGGGGGGNATASPSSAAPPGNGTSGGGAVAESAADSAAVKDAVGALDLGAAAEAANVTGRHVLAVGGGRWRRKRRRVLLVRRGAAGKEVVSERRPRQAVASWEAEAHEAQRGSGAAEGGGPDGARARSGRRRLRT